MQCTVQPGNVAVYGGGNLSCFPACEHLGDLTQLLVQVGALSSRHAISYIPPNPE